MFIKELEKKIGKLLYERENGYVLIIGDVRGEKVVFCFKEGYTGYYYVKVLLEKQAETLSCRTLEYLPYGLYAFSNEPLNLVEKSISKALLLLEMKPTVK